MADSSGLFRDTKPLLTDLWAGGFEEIHAGRAHPAVEWIKKCYLLLQTVGTAYLTNVLRQRSNVQLLE